MPPGDYPTIDWGARSEFRHAPLGTRITTRYPVQSADDWRKIDVIDADRGFNAEIIRTCRLVREAIGPDVPVLQTIFSPLTIAKKLSDGRVIDHMRTDPKPVHGALECIRDVTIQVTRRSLAGGADGIFFATQCATSDLVTREEYDEFGSRYDRPVLIAAAQSASIFTVIHIHGVNSFFDMLAQYDVHAISWHDRRLGPSIKEVLETYPDRAAVGGIDENAIVSMTPDAVKRHVHKARRPVKDRRLLIGPGCVVPVATSEINLNAAVQASRHTII
jgi:uroporphyrinogen decarboxylase